MADKKSVQNKRRCHQKRERADHDASDERLEKFPCLELQKLAQFHSIFH